jgi:hypothetical protein
MHTLRFQKNSVKILVVCGGWEPAKTSSFFGLIWFDLPSITTRQFWRFVTGGRGSAGAGTILPPPAPFPWLHCNASFIRCPTGGRARGSIVKLGIPAIKKFAPVVGGRRAREGGGRRKEF